MRRLLVAICRFLGFGSRTTIVVPRLDEGRLHVAPTDLERRLRGRR